MYLAIPLRGDFQVDCELTGSPDRKIRLQYGGLAIGPSADLKHVERAQFGRPVAELSINPPLEKPAEWFPYRLVVKGGRMTAFINGRKVHDAPAPPDVDPWVAFLTQDIQAGAARKFKIAGNPTNPRKTQSVRRSPISVVGWRPNTATRSSATTPTGTSAERRLPAELSRMISRAASRKAYCATIALWSRTAGSPTSFTYDPGKVMVHPALDRLAFLLEPDGVKVHRLTDGAYERSGLTADNARDEPECRRGPASIPLKPASWNQLILSVTGDKVALELNGQQVFDRPIEPVNQRIIRLVSLRRRDASTRS